VESAGARKAKGIIIAQHVRILRKAKNERLLQGLSPEHRQMLASRILPSSWYPYDFYAATLDIIYRRIAGGEPESARNMGQFVATLTLQEQYSLFLKAGNPAETLRLFPSIWHNFFNFGKTACRMPDGASDAESPKSVVMDLSEFPDIPRALCLIMQGFLEKTVELAGGVDPAVHELTCATRGDSSCGCQVEWRKVLSA
jgi:hypothetical protein